ncbi:MAG: hypothetical protein RBG13Loki_2590 [Promethearchaeota archaeon CR_4]|nr:MAG: hypothetical protein RBG13Loki_2590 [Candidatus Lokiarchaeota archaeon CR_4]
MTNLGRNGRKNLSRPRTSRGMQTEPPYAALKKTKLHLNSSAMVSAARFLPGKIIEMGVIMTSTRSGSTLLEPSSGLPTGLLSAPANFTRTNLNLQVMELAARSLPGKIGVAGFPTLMSTPSGSIPRESYDGPLMEPPSAPRKIKKSPFTS